MGLKSKFRRLCTADHLFSFPVSVQEFQGMEFPAGHLCKGALFVQVILITDLLSLDRCGGTLRRYRQPRITCNVLCRRQRRCTH
jgi:hypothetical protein